MLNLHTVKKRTRTGLLFIAFLIVWQQQAKAQEKTLLVFFDGLRPDYITPEAMPRLYAFKKTAVYGTQHHSVYPTVTRVNASSYSTGSYPDHNGILGNTVYFPEVDKVKGLNTGDAADLFRIEKATDGHLLTAISLGEQLQQNGQRMMVFSSGSTGQALMQNHKVSGGAIVNPGLILPESFKQTVITDLGPIPANTKPNTLQHAWITDAFLRYGAAPEGPLVSAVWFSDPDGTAHAEGIGSAKAMESIRIVDQEFGRILDSLEKRNLLSRYNIIVSTDHGFVTNIGKEGIAELLIKEGLKQSKESEDIIVAEGAVYVKDHNQEKIKSIVRLLQAQEWVGPVFTKADKPGSFKGWVRGTLSFESIHWNHPDRSADILVDENWDDRKNAAGYAGASFSRGVAGHGGLSPYEVHIPLLARGPAFKTAAESAWPTSNIDIVPTVLHIHHLSVPPGMQGRVMYELLHEKTRNDKKKKTTAAPEEETIQTSAELENMTYRLELSQTLLGKYRYVNFAKITRVRK